MKLIQLFLFCLLSCIPGQLLFAQGFDWLKSWRLPSDSPTIFIGGYMGYGMNTEYVDSMSFSNVLDCCGFKAGSGNDIRFGLTGEYWLQGDISIQGQIGLGITSASFNAQKEDIILIPKDNRVDKVKLIRDYTLTSRIQSLELAMLAKHRLFSSHLSVALGFSGSFTLPNDSMYELKMRANVDSIELVSKEFTPNQEYTSNEMVKDIEISGFLFRPVIRLEYDLSIFNEIYVKPYTQLDITLNSRVSRDDPWRSLTFLGGFSILFSY
jgi:hypothetical protein